MRQSDPRLDYVLPDTGCDAHPAWDSDPVRNKASCFTCPLPECRYVTGVRSDMALARARGAQARRLQKDGLTAKEIAGALGVTDRTIYRAVKRSG